MTLTEQQQKVADLLEGVTLAHGLGTEEGPCTFAAVNLALTGKLTDACPTCVCPVLHAWVIPVQDAMPLDQLNGPEWRALVPLLAGSVSTPEVEQARAGRIMEWMWDRLGDEDVLASVPEAVRPAWDRMLTERTAEAAWAAEAVAAWAAKVAAARAAGDDARAAAMAAGAAWDAAEAAGDAARAAARAAWDDARAAAMAAGAAWDAAEAARAAYWHRANPAGLLAELLAMGEAA